MGIEAAGTKDSDHRSEKHFLTELELHLKMSLLLQVNPMHMPWAVPSLYGVEDTVASGERPAAQRLATYRLVRPVFDSCGRSTYTMVHPNLCPVYLMYVLYIYICIYIYIHTYI